jgi:hypothetical protein
VRGMEESGVEKDERDRGDGRERMTGGRYSARLL